MEIREKENQITPVSEGINSLKASSRPFSLNERKNWQLVFATGVAPKTVLFKYRNYSLSYHIYWNARNQPIFWYGKVFYNRHEIAEFNNPQEIEHFVKSKGLPSIRGLPYIFGEVE